MRKFTYLIGLWLATLATQAQIELVSDISPGTKQETITASFIGGQPLGDILFLVAEHPQFGRELWRMSASEEISLVKDIYPGIESGLVSEDVTFYSGKAYFCGRDSEGVMNLYSTDGTEEGTTEVVQFYESGAENFYHVGSVEVNGKLLLQITRGEGVTDIWITDGTASGTSVLSNSIFIEDGVVIGTKLIVPGYDPDHGEELWVTDGTIEGTGLFKDIETGSDGSQPGRLALIGSEIYFRARNAGNRNLWKTDGTVEGTVLVKELNVDGGFTLYNDLIYFSSNVVGGTTGSELFVTDGTTDGTVLVKEFLPGGVGGFPDNFFVADGLLYFSAQLNGIGFELFTSDGTEEGTGLLKDLANPGQSGPRDHFIFNDTHYFMANTGTGPGLWKTDGTAEGTVLVKQLLDQFAGSTLPIIFNGKAYFSAGVKLFKTDGTSEGTLPIDFYIETGNNSSPVNFMTTSVGTFFGGVSGEEEDGQLFITEGEIVVNLSNNQVILDDNDDGGVAANTSFVNNKLFFSGYTDAEEEELWVSDGTVEGTILLKDINAEGPSYPHNFFAFNDKVFFNAEENVNGSELWVSDGTTDGTTIFKNINGGDENSSPSSFYTLGDEFVFRAREGSSGFELHKSDGTADGTALVKDLRPGSSEGVAEIYGVFLNKVFLLGDDGGGAGWELWTTDGTAGGYELLGDFNPGPSSGSFREEAFTELNGKVVFVTEEKIWATDGTASGTSLITNEVLDGYYFEGKVSVLDGKMIFVGYEDDEDDNRTYSLFYTDGTNEGTGILLTDIEVDFELVEPYDGAYLNAAAESGSTLYFTLGRGIYATDGTPAGTSYIAEDKDGQELGARYPIVANDKLYFTAKRSSDGINTLFQSDGTETGTLELDNEGVDIRGQLYLISDEIYFAGFTIALGEELYTFNTLKQPQTITFNTVSDKFLESGSFTLSATASSGLPVSFEVISGPASVTGNTVSLLEAGDVTIRASQSGSDNFFAAQSVDQSFKILLVTGIPESTQYSVLAYPNPVTHQLNVMTSGARSQLSVRDTQGRLITSVEAYNKEVIQLDASSWPVGMYILRVASESGIAVTKILKK